MPGHIEDINASHGQHHHHRRNQMTLSQIPQIVVTTEDGNSYSPADSGPDSVIFGKGKGKEKLGSKSGTVFAARQPVNKGKQIASPSAPDSIELVHLQAYNSISQQPLMQSWRRPSLERRVSESSDDSSSTIGPKSWNPVEAMVGSPSSASKTAGRVYFQLDDLKSRKSDPMQSSSRPALGRTMSASSNDSSSTIADDSWNPVEDFIGTSSSAEELDTNHAVSLFDLDSERAQPLPIVERTMDPSEMSWEDVRHYYPLVLYDLAGHEDGIAVYDAAYIMGKAPKNDLEWDQSQLTLEYGIASPSSNATTPEEDDITYLGDYLVDVNEWTTSIGDIQEHRDPSPADDGQPLLLQSTVYVPPDQSTRMIAKGAGSIIFNYADGSDGDDESSLPAETRTPPSPHVEVTTIGYEEYEALIPAENLERTNSITFLQQLSACILQLPGLNRDHQTH
jgi:hypothetical protein